MNPKEQDEIDNRSNQLNPNNEKYYSSRGETGPTYDDDDDGNDDDDDDSDNDNSSSGDDNNDDWQNDFEEEWVPQDAW